ncbi:MAG: type II/IV secretion system ATPase subunit [Candidatus Altiarchaeota archaeon]
MAQITPEFQDAMNRNPRLKTYISNLKDIPIPTFTAQLNRDMKHEDFPNYIYPVGDPIFIHAYKKRGEGMFWQAIEPELNEKEKEFYEEVSDKLIAIAHMLPSESESEELTNILSKLLNNACEVEGVSSDQLGEKYSEVSVTKKIKVNLQEYQNLKYMMIRDRAGYGYLEPLLRDPYIEDIHVTGVGRVYMVHKIFDVCPTSIVFENDMVLDRYVFDASERVERPVSVARPVIDAVMPDGSRVNFIYGREISLEGTSFTIRKFAKIPVSITQLISWNTGAAKNAAYLWLCLENGMSLFVCGETASGKTTTLNAICAFIRPDAKIFTVENTPEVTMPHEIWQHLLTREAGRDTDIKEFTLLKAALRSRPNYIIVGEIRGAEGAVAFQAMQTGHSTMATFHAGSVHQMIQRLIGDPINVPIAFIDNLNVVLIQQAVYHNGRFIRRILSITELTKYYDELNKVGSSQVFQWDPVKDEHIFRGFHNSFVLEEKIAKQLGYEDPREIYNELDKRERILTKMVDEKIFNYFDVWKVIKAYREDGEKGLPFTI